MKREEEKPDKTEEMGMFQKHYLEHLSTLPAVIKVRSREWRKFFPHLSDITLTRLLEKGFIACPAVMVKDTVHILSVRRIDKQTIGISYFWACRVDENTYDYPYENSAVKFANQYWKTGRVYPDGWHEVHRIFLQDPCDLKVLDQNIWVALDWSFSMDNYGYAPLSEKYDKATVHITDNWVIAQELSSGKSCHSYSRCAHCGWGLCSFPCKGCKRNFKYPQVHHANIGDCCLKGALPQKTEAQFIKMGHLFTADTEKSREDEKREWQKSAENLRRKTERT